MLKLILFISFVINICECSKDLPLTFAETNTNVKVDFNFLRNKVKKYGIDSNLFHHRELMNAIHDEKYKFITSENITKDDLNLDNLIFEDLIKQTIHNSSVSYEIKKDLNFFSFDLHEHIDTIHEIGDNHVIHCRDINDMRKLNEQKSVFNSKKNDIFIASSYGANIHSKEDKFNPLSDYMLTTKHITRNKEGVKLIRQVIKKEEYDHTDITKKCLKFHTEDIHMIELFDNFEINSDVIHPFTKSYLTEQQIKANLQKEKEEKQKILQDERKLGWFSGTNIYSCDDAWWRPYFYDPLFFQYDGTNFDFAYASTYACAQYSTSMSAFEVNYNLQTQTVITPNMNLVANSDVLTCQNCYLYLGSTFNINVQYSYTYGFAFATKLWGGAGFNIAVQTKQNPSFSGTFTTQLMGTGGSITIPIYSGLSLTTQLEGLYATVSGSGSATGSAWLQGGASASASVGVLYDYNDQVSIPYTSSFSYRAPAYGSSLADVRFNINAALTATFSFELDFSGILSGTYEASMTEYVEYNNNGGVSASYSVSTNYDSSLRKLIGIKSYVPGEIVPITISYEGFIPNEDINIYVSILKFNSNDETAEKHHIYSNLYKNSESGSGEFLVEYIVPWNTLFANENDEWCVEVHMSNQMSKKIDSCSNVKFKIISFTEKDSIFEKLPDKLMIDKEYTLNWNKDLLSYYHVTNVFLGIGEQRISKEVGIYLISLNDLNSTNSSIKLNENNLKNSGSSTITITKDILNQLIGNEYYFIVQSAELTYIHGWSSSTFQIVGNSNNLISSFESNSNVISIKKRKTDFKLKHKTSGSHELYNSIEERNSPNRKLQAACPDATIYTGSEASGGNNVVMNICGIGYNFYINSFALELLKSQVCVSSPPVSAPPSPHPVQYPTFAPVTHNPTIQVTQPTYFPTFYPTLRPTSVLFTCPSFSLTNTNNARQNYQDCVLTNVCPGTTLTISGCQICTEDQYLRLYDATNTNIISNDDGIGSCGRCSEISWKTTGPCQDYTIRQGCYSSSTCSGTTIVTSDIVPTLTSSPTANPTTRSPTANPSSTSPSFRPSPEPSFIPSKFPTEFPTSSQFYCSEYSTSNTNNDLQNFVTCLVHSCPGETLVISGCGGNGDQFLRLYDSSNNQVAYDDDSCGITAGSAQISYLVPLGVQCQIYSIHQGCYDDSSCGGTVRVTGGIDATYTPSATPTADPSIAPTANPSATSTANPSATPTPDPSATPTVASNTASPTFLSTSLLTLSPSKLPTLAPTFESILTEFTVTQELDGIAESSWTSDINAIFITSLLDCFDTPKPSVTVVAPDVVLNTVRTLRRKLLQSSIIEIIYTISVINIDGDAKGQYISLTDKLMTSITGGILNMHLSTNGAPFSSSVTEFTLSEATYTKSGSDDDLYDDLNNTFEASSSSSSLTTIIIACIILLLIGSSAAYYFYLQKEKQLKLNKNSNDKVIENDEKGFDSQIELNPLQNSNAIISINEKNNSSETTSDQHQSGVKSIVVDDNL